jgi:hypothetical protein
VLPAASQYLLTRAAPILRARAQVSVLQPAVGFAAELAWLAEKSQHPVRRDSVRVCVHVCVRGVCVCVCACVCMIHYGVLSAQHAVPKQFFLFLKNVFVW